MYTKCAGKIASKKNESEVLIMQVRCYKCHTPFAIKRDLVHAALDMLVEEGLSHYDARCPKCRTTNRISKEQLMHSAPKWKQQQEQSEGDVS